ncbi:MAG TPA: polysaccharide biosynthesis/export family protein [Terriglobales bacterium]|nr:polysaccharide biosynthesis/export family protein [Terriglobales bacterium]
MNRTWRAAAAALLIFGSVALAQDAAPAQPSGSSAAEVPAPAAQAGPEYVIGPEDVLHVAVWKEADLTATLPVRPDGKISLPLLNDVQAAGMTPMQLADSITEKLKKYVASPRVTVVVTAINSKRIYLTGEVSHPGAMPMLPNMTVLQALSSAGLTQFANTKKIYVLRTQNGKEEKLPVDYRRLLKGEKMDQNYRLLPGDTIVVP